MQTIAFIGLGKMGAPIAANLLSAGHSIHLFNRTPARADDLVKKGAALAPSPAAAAASAGGFVLSILADDRALEEICTDEFLRALGAAGGVHVSMSTVSPATTRRLAERHTQFGATLIGAPVFGRPEAAAAAKLYVCLAGSDAAKQRVRPILAAISQGIFDFGEEVGAANVVKLAGNFLLTAAIEAMAEVSALVEKNGIPRADVLNMFTSTLFNCPIYVNYGKRVIAADYENAGFTIPLILKDMHLVQQTAAASRAPMPMVNLLCDRYLTLLAKGKDHLDASAIALGAGEDAGLKW